MKHLIVSLSALIICASAVAQNEIENINSLLSKYDNTGIMVTCNNVKERMYSIRASYTESNWKLILDMHNSSLKSHRIELSIYQVLTRAGNWYYRYGEWYQDGITTEVRISYNPDYGTNYGDLLFDQKAISDKIVLSFNSKDDADCFAYYMNKLNFKNKDGWWIQVVENEENKNKNSKQIFNELSSDFRKYKITSESAEYQGFVVSNNFKLKFSYPYLFITYVNAPEHSGMMIDGLGTYEVKIPIVDASFDVKEHSDFLSRNKICIYSPQEIEVKYKGQIELTNSVVFFTTGKSNESIVSKLRVFKRKIKAENYTGKYGFSEQTTVNNNQPKKISNTFVQ